MTEPNRTTGGLKKQYIFIAVAAVLLIVGIYAYSKYEDRRIVETRYENKDFSEGRILSDRKDLYDRKEKILSSRMESLEAKLQLLTEALTKEKEAPVEEKAEAQADPGRELKTEVLPTSAPYTLRPQVFYQPKKDAKGPAIISFPTKKVEKPAELGVKIPSGSYVKAKLLTGIEAPEGKTYPALLEADYAFVGPNKTRIDLSGCFLIAKSTGNLSIERVEMQATKISCVAKSGKSFEREISGYIADDKDNSFAVMGSVNSKQDRVASMAFLSAVIEGISGAVAKSQTSTERTSAGSFTSVTGDEGKYIASGGASTAASVVTQWYLKHAESLLPTINIGSGQDVWMIVQDGVEIPNWYFREESVHKPSFSY